jgi:hypothetical protein
MKCRSFLASASVLVVVLFASALVPVASAQESRSASLAKELTTLLQEKKLDSIAARAPSGADQFVAALFFPGQLLVVSARYSAPPVLMERIARSEYRDVYIDLNSAAVPESRILITDLGADGLRPRREANQPFDIQDVNGKGIQFDGNWREDKMSEEEYMKAFAQADQNYTAALEVLIGALKKP